MHKNFIIALKIIAIAVIFSLGAAGSTVLGNELIKETREGNTGLTPEQITTLSLLGALPVTTLIAIAFIMLREWFISTHFDVNSDDSLLFHFLLSTSFLPSSLLSVLVGSFLANEKIGIESTSVKPNALLSSVIAGSFVVWGGSVALGAGGYGLYRCKKAAVSSLQEHELESQRQTPSERQSSSMRGR